MKKLTALVAGAFLLMAGSAAAANISNVEYSNGDVTIQGTGGSSVTGQVRIEVGNNEEVEMVQFDVVSDSLAAHCVDTGRLQEGTHFVNIEGVKFPPNTGTYSLNVTAHGIFGGMAANDCVGDQVDSTSFSSSVRTVGSSNSVSGGSMIEQLQKQIADLLKMIADLKNPPASTKPAGCASVVAFNGYNAWEAQTSLFAVDAGRAVFNQNGVYSPTGHFKTISQQAAAAVAVACK